LDRQPRDSDSDDDGYRYKEEPSPRRSRPSSRNSRSESPPFRSVSPRRSPSPGRSRSPVNYDSQDSHDRPPRRRFSDDEDRSASPRYSRSRSPSPGASQLSRREARRRRKEERNGGYQDGPYRGRPKKRADFDDDDEDERDRRDDRSSDREEDDWDGDRDRDRDRDRDTSKYHKKHSGGSRRGRSRSLSNSSEDGWRDQAPLDPDEGEDDEDYDRPFLDPQQSVYQYNSEGEHGSDEGKASPKLTAAKPSLITLDKKKELHSKGLSPQIFNGLEIPLILRELHNFIRLPPSAGLGTQIRCFIERSRSGTNKLAPVYTLYADHEDGSGRLLLSARKLLKSRESHYVISTNQDDLYKKRSDRSRHYMGKLRGNAAGTEYTLFDDGASPKELGFDIEEDEEKSAFSEDATEKISMTERQREQLRKELCVVHYEPVSKKDKERGVRRMETCIPAVVGFGGPVEEEEGGVRGVKVWQPLLSRDGMTANFARVRYQKASNVLLSDRLFCFHLRESKYDPLSSCLVDFKERASCASVKNFQMIKSFPQDPSKLSKYRSEGFPGHGDPEEVEAPSPILLQMGKVGKHCFNVDYQYPLSMLQAFAICLSRFDTGTI